METGNLHCHSQQFTIVSSLRAGIANSNKMLSRAFILFILVGPPPLIVRFSCEFLIDKQLTHAHNIRWCTVFLIGHIIIMPAIGKLSQNQVPQITFSIMQLL